ncbi:MAG: hypothetical protein QHH09_00615 [Microgenomates group bacterium]|nr:hypothetical protein [Microgenomates group bacterium]
MSSPIEGSGFQPTTTTPQGVIERFAGALYHRGHPDAAIRTLKFFDGLCSLGSGNNLKRAVRFGPILLPTAILAASCVAKPPAEVRPATLTPTPPFTLTPTPTETPTATPSPTPEPSPTPTTTPEPPPTSTPSPTPEPTSTPTPTEAPTETTVPSQYEKLTTGEYIYTTEAGEKITIGKIAGLKQDLLASSTGDLKVVYRAEKNNPYGLSEGDYGGEFCPGVFTGRPEKQTGGLVLNSKVSLKILKDQLAKIPNQRDRWLIPLPVDIRGLQKVVLLYESGYGDYQVPVIKILFSGEALVSNVMPNVTTLRVARNIYYGWVFFGNFRRVEPYTDKVYPGREMDYVTVAGQMTDFSSNSTIEVSFGEKVSFVKSFAIVSVGAVNEHFTSTPDKTLSVGGLPVFVATDWVLK